MNNQLVTSSGTSPSLAKTTKDTFVKETGKKTLPLPKFRVKKGSETQALKLKLLLYGNYGTGKTYSIADLLRLGFKVFVLSTDLGGSGLLSVQMALRQTGDEALLETHLRELELTEYDDVINFLHTPSKFTWEEDGKPTNIYDFDPDFIFWDGFSTFQQVALTEKVSEMPTSKKDLPDAVESGLFLGQDQWGMMRTGTYRAIAQFCNLNNKKTGKVWHVIMTMQEDLKLLEGKTVESKVPFIQGGAGKLMGGAFDLIVYTRKTISTTDKGVEEKFSYNFTGDGFLTKKRGLRFPNTMTGNFKELWTSIETQIGLKRGAVDEHTKEQ